MRIDDNFTPARAARVAADRAIVMREKARIRTTDGNRAINGSARTTDVRTTDPALSWQSKQQRSRFRFDDTVLSAEPTSFNPQMNGTVWAGNVKAQLDAMSATDRAKALDGLRRVVRDYENGMSTEMDSGNAGSFASGATPQDVNDANRKYWDAMAANNLVTRDSAPRDTMQAKVAAINAANAQFWSRQTAHQHRPEREWGKG